MHKDAAVNKADALTGADKPIASGGTATAERAITKLESAAVFGASLVGAAATLIATVFAKHTLSGTELTEFLLFWSLLFALYAVPAGAYPEIVRAVGVAQKHRITDGSRAITVSLGLGVAIALLLAASACIWAPKQLPSNTEATITVLTLSVLCYAVQTTMYGTAAGRGKWWQYAALLSSEPLLRLLLMGAVMITAGGLFALEVAAAAPVVIWVIFVIFSRDARQSLLARVDVSSGKLIRNIMYTVLAAAFTALLVTGLPNLLQASQIVEHNTDDSTLLAILILAIIICRAPIMLPLGSIQSIAIKAFLEQQHRPIQALTKPLLALLTVGVVGAGLAYMLAPWLFQLVYPPRATELAAYDRVANGTVLALLVFAGALLALLTITGTAALATNRHRLYVAGWAVGAITAIALIFLPLDIVSRTLIALYTGPIVGAFCHLIGLFRTKR